MRLTYFVLAILAVLSLPVSSRAQEVARLAAITDTTNAVLRRDDHGRSMSLQETDFIGTKATPRASNRIGALRPGVYRSLRTERFFNRVAEISSCWPARRRGAWICNCALQRSRICHVSGAAPWSPSPSKLGGILIHGKCRVCPSMAEIGSNSPCHAGAE